MLQRAKASGAPIAIYSNEADPSEYDVGLIDSVSRNHVAYRAVSPKGDFDGERIVYVESIFRIDTGSSYLEKMRVLNENLTLAYSSPLESLADEPDPESMLREAQRQGQVVSIVDRIGYGPKGFVREVGSDYVEVERLDLNGLPDGSVVVMLDMVERIVIGGRDEQALAFLYRFQVESKRLIDG